MAEDISASVAAAQPLLQSLSDWRESLPLPAGYPCQHPAPQDLALNPDSSQTTTTTGPFPATIYQSYLTLLVYVWRALLRTTVRSSAPPHIIHIEDPSESGMFLRDLTWAGAEYAPAAATADSAAEADTTTRPPDGVNQPGAWGDTSSSSSVVGELYEAALSCARSVLDFVAALEYAAFGGFWHSCKSHTPTHTHTDTDTKPLPGT